MNQSIPSKEEFNAMLRAKLVEAGVTSKNAHLLGTMTAEFKAALQMTQAAMKESGVSPLALMMPMLALSATFGRLLTFTSEKLNVLPEEIITVSEIVGSECLKRAEAQFPEMEQSAGEQSDRLEPNGPTDPSQVN